MSPFSLAVSPPSGHGPAHQPGGAQRHHLVPDAQVGARPRTRPELQDHLPAQRRGEGPHCESMLFFITQYLSSDWLKSAAE